MSQIVNKFITNGTVNLTTKVTGALPIANGGTGQTTQTAAMDALAPTTTKGDLIVRTSSTNVRQAVGTDGTFLKADSSETNGITWASTNGVLAIRSVTTTDTCTNADDTLILSGASFTETLFTAVGNSGKVLRLVHNGTSITQVYTINTTGGQTVAGQASGGFVLYTNGESLVIQSDGANWLKLDHDAETAWVNAGTITIQATTTNPTKGNTQSIDKTWWKREGDSAHIRMNFRQTSGTGSAAGSGDYLFVIPSAIGTIDTAKLDIYATTEGWNGSYQNAFAVGICTVNDGTSDGVGSVVPYSSTQVRMFVQLASGAAGAIGSAGLPLTAANAQYSLDFYVPISGWQP